MSQASTTSLRPPPPSPSVTTPPSGSFSPADVSRNVSEHMSPSTKHGLAITLGIVCTAFALLVIWAIWRFWQNFWFANRVSGTKRRKKRMFWRTKSTEGGCVEAGIHEEKEVIEEVTNEKRKEAENMSPTSSRLLTPPRLPALIWSPRRNSSRSKHQHDESSSSLPPYSPASPSPLGVSSSSSPSPPPFPAVATSSTSTSPLSQNRNTPPPNPFFTPLPPPLPRKPHQRSPRNSIISSLHPNYYYQGHSYSSGSMDSRDVPLGRGQNRVGRSPLSVSSSSGIPSDYEVEEEEDDKEREDDNSADSTQEGQSFGNGNGNAHTHIYMKPSQLGVGAAGNGNGNGHSRRSSCSFSGSMMLNTILEGGGNGLSSGNEHSGTGVP